MLTVEYRVNGQLIGATHIHNLFTLPDSSDNDPICRYEVEHWGNEKGVVKLEVLHHRNRGFEVLVGKVLKAICKELKSASDNHGH